MDALEKIALEAQGLESEQQAAEDAITNPPEENPVDQAAVWAQLPKMFGGILSMALPELGAVYTDERCYAWGGAMSLVADKYGWDAAETMAKWGPEIALTVASLPLVVPTFKAIKKAKEKADAAKPEDAQNVKDVPGGGSVQE